MENRIEINKLCKSYSATKALVDFSYGFGAGIYGLLGPNGSGKTTLMNILTDNLKYDSGEISYKGKPLKTVKKEYISHIGYMPQSPGLYPAFTAADYLNYISVLKGVGRSAARAQIETLLKAMELWDVRNDRIRTFSGGMKQRLALAQAFLGDPELIILDEPTAGLDPGKRIAVRNFISENALDKTVIIATHVVSDIEFIARDIIMLKKGVIAETGTPAELTAKAAGSVWTICTGKDGDEIKRMRELYDIVSIRSDGENAYVRVLSDERPENGEPAQPVLEDRYLKVFGEQTGTE
ncbi:MAG: ATP-binding cassette domain-containing protein [Clostridia bacterium]|nr:ATP-binding cassette domain-containing protein [Clostridia bacterium]